MNAALNSLWLKALIGAAVVVLIGMLARSKNYYVAGLVPLFPTFALMAHSLVASERGIPELKTTIVFGAWAVIPYFTYLAVLYLLSDRLSLPAAMALAIGAWGLSALILMGIWTRVHPA